MPLLFQLGLLTALWQLQEQAEQQLIRTERARELADAVNRMGNHAMEVISTYGAEQSIKDVSLANGQYQSLINQLTSDYEKLKALTDNDATKNGTVVKSERAAFDALAALQQLKSNRERGGPDEKQSRKRLWKEIRRLLPAVVPDEMTALGLAEKRYADQSIKMQSNFRKQATDLMLIGGIANAILTATLAVLLTKGVTLRLSKLRDNTLRLANNRPLTAILSGNDEIAQVDHTFHEMARELRNAQRKERAIVENARDLIFSLDANGRFVAANPASEDILGIPEEELLGLYLIDRVKSATVARVLDYMQELKRNEFLNPLEFELLHANGTYQVVLWSAYWSKDSDLYFCVLHDVSAFKEAQRLKEEVTAMISHDLRTPLSTISNVLDLLNGGALGKIEDKAAVYVNRARLNADRMISLINDLLDMEKIKSGQMDLERAPIELKDLLTECEELILGFAEEMGVKIAFETTALVVNADRERMQRVVYNLVSNAIKFSPRGGTVSIKTLSKNNFAHVLVSDQGPGIAPEQLESIFVRFLQASSHVAKLKGGSGLGLAICKEMVELHGGKIWAESVVGKGSTFIFTIPLADR